MSSIRRGWLMVVALLLTNCATMRTWQLPLSPAEGSTYVPALISVAQNEGLEAYRGRSGVNVTLPDGTLLSWSDSANHADFLLFIHLPSDTPEAAYEERFQAAKLRADQLWEKATLARRSLALAPAMSIVQPTSCMTSSDGTRACGYHCMLSSHGRAECAATPDGTCHLNSNGTVSCGTNCHFTSSGTWSCW